MIRLLISTLILFGNFSFLEQLSIGVKAFRLDMSFDVVHLLA